MKRGINEVDVAGGGTNVPSSSSNRTERHYREALNVATAIGSSFHNFRLPLEVNPWVKGIFGAWLDPTAVPGSLPLLGHVAATVGAATVQRHLKHCDPGILLQRTS